jgi:hypothetical protein
MKTQLVRIADVAFIGPFMIYAATKLKGNDKAIMAALGVATIIYNGINFIKYEKSN